MKVAYFNGGPATPSVIFRRPFFDHLNERGHQVHFYDSFPGRYDHWPMLGWRASQMTKRAVRRWQIQRIRLGRYDAVVLETGLFHRDDHSMEQRLRKVTKRLVYDIDDAVFLLFPKKISRIASISDHVIAGNAAIAEWINDYNSSISIIPTCVDQQRYPSKWDALGTDPDSQQPRRLAIGWIGSAGNVDLLTPLLPTLNELNRNHPLELRVITAESAHRSLASTDHPIRWIDIDRCDQMQQVREFDVGIMPLPMDDPWSTYKCNAKMIQYMASGVPAIGSDLGFNRTLVRSGENGFLAATQADWLDAATQLAKSPELRRSIGRSARATVLDRFTVQSQIDSFERAVFGSDLLS